MKRVKALLKRMSKPWRVDPAERLRRLGVRIGRNVSLQPGVVIDESHGWLICIGDDVTLAPRVVVLAHDASSKRAIGFTRIGCVSIGDRAFIGGNSIVLPGVHIGSDCIIGAGSVVSHDIPAGHVAAGNPARVLYSTQDYLAKRRAQLSASPVFGLEYTLAGGVTKAMQSEMSARMEGRHGFVE